MTTRIGLISDVHGYADPLAEALNVFRKEGVSVVLNLGDVAGYGNQLDRTVALLKENECISIMGNHEAWYLDKKGEEQDDSMRAFFSGLPMSWESVIEGVRVYGVHASPPGSINRGIRLLDEKGDVLAEEKEYWAGELVEYPYDVLLIGHTHQVFAQQLGNMLVINPGSTAFNHTCAILSLPDKQVRIVPLSGEKPILAWNWGMMKMNGAVESEN